MSGASNQIGKMFPPKRPGAMDPAKLQREMPLEPEKPAAQEVKDRIDIGNSPTAQVSAPSQGEEAKVDSKDLNRYLEMLKEMPDIREEEVGRVEAILAEDGYGPEALSAVVDELMGQDI